MNGTLKKSLLTLLFLCNITSSMFCMETENNNAYNIIEAIKKNSEPNTESYLANLKSVAQCYLLFFNWNKEVQTTIIPSLMRLQTLLPDITTRNDCLFSGLAYEINKHTTLIDTQHQKESTLNKIYEQCKEIKAQDPIPAQQGPALVYETNTINHVAILEPESRAALFQHWYIMKSMKNKAPQKSSYTWATNLQNHPHDGVKAIGKSIEVMLLNNVCFPFFNDHPLLNDQNPFYAALRSTTDIPVLKELNPRSFCYLYEKFMGSVYQLILNHRSEYLTNETILFSIDDTKSLITLNNDLALKQLHDNNTLVKNAYAQIIKTITSEITNRRKTHLYSYVKFYASPKYDTLHFPAELCLLELYIQELQKPANTQITSNTYAKKQKKSINKKSTIKSTTQKNKATKKQSIKEHDHSKAKPLEKQATKSAKEPAINSAIQTKNNALTQIPTIKYAHRVTRWFDTHTNDQEIQNATKQSILYHSFPLIADKHIFSLGIQTPWQNQTKPTQIDTNYSLGGEIIYSNGTSKTVVFTCCKDIHGTCYHRGFMVKEGNSLFDEYFQHSKWEIDFPPFTGGLTEEKPIQIHPSENDTCVIEDNYLCVRITDIKNNVTIMLYKPYQD